MMVYFLKENLKTDINEGKKIDYKNLNVNDENNKDEYIKENICDNFAKMIGYLVIYILILVLM